MTIAARRGRPPEPLSGAPVLKRRPLLVGEKLVVTRRLAEVIVCALQAGEAEICVVDICDHGDGARILVVERLTEVDEAAGRDARVRRAPSGRHLQAAENQR